MTVPDARAVTLRRGAFAAVDLVIVVSFVVIGRDAHEETLGIGDLARTAGPFVLGLAGAWLTPVVHRTPWRLSAGIASGAITTGAGVYFRAVVFREGISGAFPVITGLYLIGLMAGARAIPRAWTRWRARGAAVG